MKKLLTCLLTFCMLSASAQLTNVSFENWVKDSTNVQLGGAFTLNVKFTDPIGWTTLNQLSNLNFFPLITGSEMVKKDTNTKFDLSSSARLRSGQLSIQGQNIKIPGMLINGKFPIDFTSLTGGGQNGSLVPPGSGLPINYRPKTFHGKYKYTSMSGEKGHIIAILRNGDEIIAQAEYLAPATGSWTTFNLDFKYGSCTMPDTMVVIFSSNDLNEVQAQSFPIGSTLWVDSVGLTTPVGFNPPLPPNAINDIVDIKCMGSQLIPFLANDKTCNLTVKLVVLGQGNPDAGTVIIQGSGMNKTILYNPTSTSEDFDYIAYTLCDSLSGACDTGFVLINIVPIKNKLVNDNDSTMKNVFRTLDVRVNDTLDNCFNNPQTTISKAPKNGTAVVNPIGTIKYTPNTGFVGMDTFNYKLCLTLNGILICDSAKVTMKIKAGAGIQSLITKVANIYPIPTSEILQVDNITDFKNIKIVDLKGAVMIDKSINTDKIQLSLSTLTNGVYQLILTNGDNTETHKICVVK
jgi:hypothetical protein